jgi:hypothetical protein
MKKTGIMITMLLVAAVLMVGCAGAPLVNQNTISTGQETNFRLLISDEIGDMDDFSSVNATITQIGFQLKGDSEGWTEFPVNVEVDLAKLPNLLAAGLWDGYLVSGNYSKVFIYIEYVEGILKDGSDTNVKVPGGKFQISKNFEVVEGQVTTFIYDITVVKAGNSGQYILKPQIDESGADQDFEEVDAQGNPKNNANQKNMGKPDNTGKPEGVGKPEKSPKPETEVEEN